MWSFMSVCVCFPFQESSDFKLKNKIRDTRKKEERERKERENITLTSRPPGKIKVMGKV